MIYGRRSFPSVDLIISFATVSDLFEFWLLSRLYPEDIGVA